MIFGKKMHNYVSEQDKFLKRFDLEHPELSESQQVEIAKHERIAKLRDEKQESTELNDVWDDF